MKAFDKRGAVRFFQSRLDFTTGPAELDRMIQRNEPVTIVDVRTPEAYRKGHIPGAINLPEERWETVEGLSQTGPNVFYCSTQQCHVSTRAALHFARNGYRALELEGGWKAWQEYGLREEVGELGRKAA